MTRLLICLVALVALGVTLEAFGVEPESDRTPRGVTIHPGEEPPCTNIYLGC